MGNISNNNIGGSITGVDYYSVIGVINTNNDVTYPTQSITGFNLPTVSPTQSGWVMVTQGTTTLGWTNSISGSVSQNLTQVLAVGSTANSWINLGQSYGVRESGATGSSVLFDSSRLFLSSSGGTGFSTINLWKNGLLQLESSNGVDGCILTISDGTHSYGTGTVYFDGTSGRGIQYYSDYSTNYTNRSLVDKEYVDNSGGSGLPGTLLVDNQTDGNNIILNNLAPNSVGADKIISSNGKNRIFFNQTPNPESVIIVSDYFDTLTFTTTSAQVQTSYEDGIFIKASIEDNIYQFSGTLQVQPQSVTSVVTNTNTWPVLSNQTQISQTADEIITRASDLNTSYLAEIGIQHDNIKINGTNPTFAGIEYDYDFSTNYTNRSLVDKAYVDTKVSGATGSTSLANVLSVGATASTSINMNSNNITGISSLGNESETTIEMINIINMSLLTLMYNT